MAEAARSKLTSPEEFVPCNHAPNPLLHALSKRVFLSFRLDLLGSCMDDVCPGQLRCFFHTLDTDYGCVSNIGVRKEHALEFRGRNCYAKKSGR